MTLHPSVMHIPLVKADTRDVRRWPRRTTARTAGRSTMNHCVSGIVEGVACPVAARPATSTAGQIVEVAARPVASRRWRAGVEASAGSRRCFASGREKSPRRWQIGAGHRRRLGRSKNDGTDFSVIRRPQIED